MRASQGVFDGKEKREKPFKTFQNLSFSLAGENAPYSCGPERMGQPCSYGAPQRRRAPVEGGRSSGNWRLPPL